VDCPCAGPVAACGGGIVRSTERLRGLTLEEGVARSVPDTKRRYNLGVSPAHTTTRASTCPARRPPCARAHTQNHRAATSKTGHQVGAVGAGQPAPRTHVRYPLLLPQMYRNGGSRRGRSPREERLGKRRREPSAKERQVNEPRTHSIHRCRTGTRGPARKRAGERIGPRQRLATRERSRRANDRSVRKTIQTIQTK